MSVKLPEGWQIRPPVETDIERMYALRQAHEYAYYGESGATIDDLYTLWTSPMYRVTEQCRLIFDASGSLVCAAYFDQRAHLRYHFSLVGTPGIDRNSLRDYLLPLCEEWVQQDMQQTPPGARTVLQSWIPAKDEQARRWYQARPDFVEVRRFWEMQIDMPSEPFTAANWPAGITLRPFDVARDTQAVFEADTTIFQDHWGFLPSDFAEWRHWTVERRNFDPSLWFIAWSGEQVAGISLCQDGEKGWVDTLGVARPWRGKGLGLALLHHTFAEFFQRGRRRVGLGVDSQSLTGATRLYERAGMHVAHEDIIYEKELRAGVELSVQTLLV